MDYGLVGFVYERQFQLIMVRNESEEWRASVRKNASLKKGHKYAKFRISYLCKFI